MNKERLRSFLTIVLSITLGVLCLGFRFGTVQGVSMQATLYDGDWILISKPSANNIKTDDIIVFWSNATAENLVKRVIGVSGDTISISDNIVYKNGEPYPSFEYIYEPTSTVYTDMPSVDVYDDEFFVLGDNRNVSLDSRYEEVGLVERGDILGVVVCDLTQRVVFDKARTLEFTVVFLGLVGCLISCICGFVCWFKCARGK